MMDIHFYTTVSTHLRTYRWYYLCMIVVVSSGVWLWMTLLPRENRTPAMSEDMLTSLHGQWVLSHFSQRDDIDTRLMEQIIFTISENASGELELSGTLCNKFTVSPVVLSSDILGGGSPHATKMYCEDIRMDIERLIFSGFEVGMRYTIADGVLSLQAAPDARFRFTKVR